LKKSARIGTFEFEKSAEYSGFKIEKSAKVIWKRLIFSVLVNKLEKYANF